MHNVAFCNWLMTFENIKNGVKVIKEQVGSMPQAAGVYKMYSVHDICLYVGKAKNLPKRVISYTKIDALPNRLRRMVSQVHRMEYVLTNTEAEALILEANLIKSDKPIYNIALKDDKSFPYIVIEQKHEFPRITKYRGKPKKGGVYFGPFASAGSVNETITQIQKIFQIRPCSDPFFSSRERPCLQYQIKRCTAPCVGKISKENYAVLIEDTKKFLNGDSTAIQEHLSKDMRMASEHMDYERAGVIRDRIKALAHIQAKNIFNNYQIQDTDLIVVYRNENGNCCLQIFFIRTGQNYGNKAYYFDDIEEDYLGEIIENFIGQFYQNNLPPKQIVVDRDIINGDDLSSALSDYVKYKVTIKKPKVGALKDLVEFAQDNAKNALMERERERIQNSQVLQGVANLFKLTKPIKRIEVYDNSHNFGTYAVGAMVVATPEGFQKGEYRSYLIQTPKKQDDYAMLREVLTRRLEKLNAKNYPSIMLVDGGKGHFGAAKEVMKSFGIDDIKLVCIAKGVNRNAGREHFYTDDQDVFQLPKGDKTLHYLQTIRDEVHRFAITAHRKKRSKDIKKSSLDDLAGIGAKRKKALLNYFGSVAAIKAASVDDIIKVDGISRKMAESILQGLC
jgi:excinuclease ABC subunit C